ncbi:orotidine-5'-phosphate decarboxylase [Serpentinicella sp. ANB-PHB4]|uniref:orotidine-5'-phosphate decarboxylase n=1 Tax=Serpentinicella sp. ANB-PHB4 TaxID=3074076 RepID=UPI002857B799|nr:orotidine-5'-phosphate decarboxylase [Serpentinicella sp. ANB-PHB4]MDR5659319.1 orotidine-5'-phosphate decarboxylase [Serpentinicella sp. ANB-PHB4]
MIDRLVKQIQEKNNPTVVGLDPRLNFVPTFIKEEAFNKYGKTPKGAAQAFYEFNKGIIDAVCDLVPAVKPQVAMYEQFGAAGVQAYIDTIRYAKEKELVIIGDIKRSDIASTAEAYSNGHIGEVSIEEKQHMVFDQDSITLNPYLGYDSIEPYMENCKKFDRGMFILVKTSNPNSGEIQDIDLGGQKLYEKIGSLVNKWGEALIGDCGYSSIGAVVGATHPEQAEVLRKIMPNNYFLVPGYGAQGGTAQDLKACFNKDGLGAIVNSSRGIIAAYKKDEKYAEQNFADAARDAVIEMQKDLLGVL